MNQELFLLELSKAMSAVNGLIGQTRPRYGYVGDSVEFPDTPDGRFAMREYTGLLESMEDILEEYRYLTRPIVKEGYLRLNARERLELDGHEFSCGDSLEIFCQYEDYNEWRLVRIEHDGTGYYAVGCQEARLNGCRARLRARHD